MRNKLNATYTEDKMDATSMPCAIIYSFVDERQ